MCIRDSDYPAYSGSYNRSLTSIKNDLVANPNTQIVIDLHRDAVGAVSYTHLDTKLIVKAYNYAKEKHGTQCRKSGEPYIIHPVQVAYILADIGLDEATICAALLLSLIHI